MNRNFNSSWLPLLGFAFLTFNSAMAIYRSDGDVAVVAFVATFYVDLMIPSVFLCRFESSEPHSPATARGKLKAAFVWVLTTLLAVMFSYKVAAIMPVPVQVPVWAMAGTTVLGGFYAFVMHRESKVLVVWAMASATVLGGFYAFFVHQESKVAAIMPVPVQLLVWARAGATVLGGFYALFLHRESKGGKPCRKDKAQQNVGVMAIVFGSGVMIDLLVVRPSTEGADNGASLVLALATFLCGTTLTLLTLPDPRFFGSQRDDVLINCLAVGCVILCMLTSLGLLWPFPRDPYPWCDVVVVAVAVALLVMLVLIIIAVSVYDHLSKIGFGKTASRITAGITVVAAGCLIGAAPELSDAAPLATSTKTAAFFLLCAAISALFVTVLSKMVASIEPSTARNRINIR